MTDQLQRKIRAAPACVGALSRSPRGALWERVSEKGFLCLAHVLKHSVTAAICINSSPTFHGGCEKLSSALRPPPR